MESITALFNHKIIDKNSISCDKCIILKGSKIIDIVDQCNIPTNVDNRIDLRGHYVAPGLIDLQVYGSRYHLFGGIPTVSALEVMENDFISQGTTGFLATVATNTLDVFN